MPVVGTVDPLESSFNANGISFPLFLKYWLCDPSPRRILQYTEIGFQTDAMISPSDWLRGPSSEHLKTCLIQFPHWLFHTYEVFWPVLGCVGTNYRHLVRNQFPEYHRRLLKKLFQFVAKHFLQYHPNFLVYEYLQPLYLLVLEILFSLLEFQTDAFKSLCDWLSDSDSIFDLLRALSSYISR